MLYHNEKIFFIGFNKTATTSLHFYFKQHNISSIHYKNNKHHILNVMLYNIKNKTPILTNLHYNIFLDFLNDDNLELYKKIYMEHPNAKYVLQIRDKKQWILSRLNFMNGNYVKFLNKKNNKNLSIPQYIKMWSQLYDKHIKDVQYFFKDLSNLYVYNIDTDNLSNLLKFLNIKCNDLQISNTYGKTKHKYYELKHITPYI